jgi:hypothetical protein
LTASSISHSNGDSCNIVEYSRDNNWCSKNKPNQWLLFNLKGFSFKIDKICFDVYWGYIPHHWQLLGSNDNKTWTTIHDQGKDERCKYGIHFVVDYNIQSSEFFTLFKFQQLHLNYNDDDYCGFFSVEFIGRLNSK